MWAVGLCPLSEGYPQALKAASAHLHPHDRSRAKLRPDRGASHFPQIATRRATATGVFLAFALGRSRGDVQCNRGSSGYAAVRSRTYGSGTQKESYDRETELPRWPW
jgi:hypothetical protein